MVIIFFLNVISNNHPCKATELLEELVRLLRKKESYRWDDQTLYPTKTYKITPFLKLLMTPRLRTLDLTRIKKECINDCAAVLHLATMRIPVRV